MIDDDCNVVLNILNKTLEHLHYRSVHSHKIVRVASRNVCSYLSYVLRTILL